MKFKLKISKKLILQLLIFGALTGAAIIFDSYIENHPEALKELQTESETTETEHGTVYLFSQTTGFSAKSPVQKSTTRKLFDQAHDKFLQKCHQLRHRQALKAEIGISRKPLYISFHNLVLRQTFFTHPDDVPLIG